MTEAFSGAPTSPQFLALCCAINREVGAWPKQGAIEFRRSQQLPLLLLLLLLLLVGMLLLPLLLLLLLL